MSISKQEIQRCFEKGIEQHNAAVMLIVTDTFHNEDYPIYCQSIREAKLRRDSLNNMQRYMESYDLRAPMEPQLNAARANCL